MSREEYQRKRAESYKRFSGAIVQYQATAGLFKKKKYLQYFLIDTAITPVLRKLFEKQIAKKIQDCSVDELSMRTIEKFIDDLSDVEILEQYQLHHGPEGSDEYVAARALFCRKAQCTFELSLADMANELITTVNRPMNKILSWSEDNLLPQWKDHGLFEEMEAQVIYKDEALTREDFQPEDIPQQTTGALDDSQRKDDPQPTEPLQHHILIEFNELRDEREKRVEKLEHAASLRRITLDKIIVEIPPPNIPKSQDYNQSITSLIKDGFQLGIYAPPRSGKNTYLKGRRHQLITSDEFHYLSYSSVKRIAQCGIITSDVDLAAEARVSLAIIPTWDVFRYRCYKSRLKTSPRDYRELLSKLGRYNYVLFTNKYVSQAMALVD